jgi:hypothetical protein
MTPDVKLTQVYAEGNRLVVVLRNENTFAEEKRIVDQVVAKYGAYPHQDLYFDLRPHSSTWAW